MRHAALVLAAALAIPGARGAERDILVVRAGRVLPITSPAVEEGVVVVENGRITGVGPAASLPIPAGARILDAPGAWLLPGFVDLHSHVGGTDINDTSVPVNPDLTVLDQIVPGNEDLLDGLAGGVTTLLFIPGSGTNLGGFGALLKTAGRDLDEAVLRYPGAMKIAQAGNPERRSGEIGRGRMGMGWNLREALREGREYHDSWTAFEEGRTKSAPAVVARHELMRGLFRREFPVLVHTQWAPVVQSSVRLLHDEFGLWVILSHAEFDAWHVAPLIVSRRIPVNVGPRAYHVDPDSGELVGLAQRHRETGVERLSINTDSPVVPEEELTTQAAMAVRLGLPWEDALRAITIEPAVAIGIDGRVGSLDVGKDADLVAWTGDPLDPRSHVLFVISGGRMALDQREGGRRW